MSGFWEIQIENKGLNIEEILKIKTKEIDAKLEKSNEAINELRIKNSKL